jgi:hypothetical protein
MAVSGGIKNNPAHGLFFILRNANFTCTVEIIMRKALLLLFLACACTNPPSNTPCTDFAADSAIADLALPIDFSTPPDLYIPDMRPSGAVPTPTIPPDYNKETAEMDCAKLYSNGSGSYVIITDITKCDIIFEKGKIDFKDTRPTSGPNMGPDPLIHRLFMAEWQAQLGGGEWFFTGQFFNPANDPTQIANGVAQAVPKLMGPGYDKWIITEGADTDLKWEGKKLTLEIWPGVSAQIFRYSLDNFFDLSHAPTAFVGYTEDADKSPAIATKRTFWGTGMIVGDSPPFIVDYRLLFVFISESATQLTAASTLRRFGAVEVRMSDGGGSVMLSIARQPYINGGSKVPMVTTIRRRP